MFDLGTIGAVVTLDDQPFRSTMAGLPGHSGAAMTQVYSHMVRALGAAGAIKLFKDAGKAAAEYGEELANIASVAPELDMSKVRAAISGLDSELGKSAALAGSYYYAYSAGMRGNEEELAKFTGQMAQLAKTVRADQVPVMDAATTLMNAYGKGVKEAAEVSDWFFTVVKQGKTTGSELAASLPLVASTAATFGVELNQLGASIAILTRTQSTGQAMSSLSQMFKSIANPTKEAKELAASYGLELSASALKAKGLAGMLAEVKDKLGGNADALAKIFPDMEGFRGIAALTGSQFQDFNNILGEFQNKAGSAAAAYRKQMESSAAAWEKAMVDINKAYVAFGQSFAPVTDAMARGISVIANGAESLSDNGVAAGIAAAAAGVMAWQAGKLVMQMLQVPGAVLSASRAITANAGAVSAETAAVSTNTLAWKANAAARGGSVGSSAAKGAAASVAKKAAKGAVKATGGKAVEFVGDVMVDVVAVKAFEQAWKNVSKVMGPAAEGAAKATAEVGKLARAYALTKSAAADLAVAAPALIAVAAAAAAAGVVTWEIMTILTAEDTAMNAARKQTDATEERFHAKRTKELSARIDQLEKVGQLSAAEAKNLRERLALIPTTEREGTDKSKGAPSTLKIIREIGQEEEEAKAKAGQDTKRQAAKEEQSKGYERDVQEAKDRAAALQRVEAEGEAELARMKAEFTANDGEYSLEEQRKVAARKVELQEAELRKVQWMQSDYAARAASSTDKTAAAQYADNAAQLGAAIPFKAAAVAEAKASERQLGEQVTQRRETREVADLRSSYIMGNGGKMDAAGEWQTNQKQLGQSKGRLSDIEAQMRAATDDEVIRTLRDRKNKEVEIYASLVKQKEELDPKKQAAKLQNEVFKDTLEGEGSVQEKTKKVLEMSTAEQQKLYQGLLKTEMAKNPKNEKLAQGNALAEYAKAVDKQNDKLSRNTDDMVTNLKGILAVLQGGNKGGGSVTLN